MSWLRLVVIEEQISKQVRGRPGQRVAGGLPEEAEAAPAMAAGNAERAD